MRLFVFILFSGIIFASPGFAEVQQYRLSSEDSRLNFEVDSTLHPVHGLAGQLEGTLLFDRETLESAMPVSIRIPAAMLDTQNGKRDKAMRKMLRAEEFPYIVWSAENADCARNKVSNELLCQVSGPLTIGDITQPVEMFISVDIQDKSIRSKGEWKFRREEFNLETPSVLGIIRVDQEIRVAFDAVWRSDLS